MEFFHHSAEDDIDTDQLRLLFDTLSQELSTPFIEKRARQSLHKKNPLGEKYTDELTDVISMLNTREKELGAALGIAKMLLDKTVVLKKLSQDYQAQAEEYNFRSNLAKNEMNALKERLINAEEQVEQTTADLRMSEEQISFLTRERNRLTIENEQLAKQTFNRDSAPSVESDDSMLLRSQRLESNYIAGIDGRT